MSVRLYCERHCMMFLTHCVMGWMLITVLGLFLPVWSAVKVVQPYRAVSINGTAQVQCFIVPQPSYQYIQPPDHQHHIYPYPDPEEVRVTLLMGLHGNQELCSSILNFTEHSGKGVNEDREVQCSVQMTEGALEVTISGLKATDTDMYRCQIEVLYPPPYLQLTGNGTLVHVLGSSDCPVEKLQREMAHQREEEKDEGDKMKTPGSAPVVVLVTLVMFVLLIMLYFQTIQCKEGRRQMVQTISGRYC